MSKNIRRRQLAEDFVKKQLAQAKPRFSRLRNPICKYFCLREEGEFFAFYNMGALKKAKKREKMPLKTRKRLNGGVALKSQKFAGNSLPRISRAIILRV